MARQFDIYRTPGGAWVVMIQSDLLDRLRTRVVAPLMPSVVGPPMRGLNPQVELAGETYVLAPQLAATFTIAELGRHVVSIAEARDAVIRATDVLLTGV